MPGIRERLRGWRTRSGLVALAALVLMAVWWWPSLSGRGDGTDVLVIGNGDVADAQTVLVRLLREKGLTVADVEPAVDWCTLRAEIASRVDAVDPRVVVVSVQDLGPCAGAPVTDTLDALATTGVDVVVVAQPGDADPVVRATTPPRRLVLADPSRLLGSGAPQRATCLWWDVDCPDGEIEVRDAGGHLTGAGAQRLARVVTAEIR